MRANSGECKFLIILDEVRNEALTNETNEIWKSYFTLNISFSKIDAFLSIDDVDRFVTFNKVIFMLQNHLEKIDDKNHNLTFVERIQIIMNWRLFVFHLYKNEIDKC